MEPLSRPATTPPTWQPVDSDAAPFAYPSSGFGQYCVRCHASAERDLTFASLENVEGEPGSFHTYPDDRSFEQGSGPATKRLHHIASRLDTSKTSFPDWKLPLSGSSASVP